MKLPPFGKSLLAARAQGLHPEVVQVIFGEDWKPALDHAPLLAVKPEQYAPGLYDWRLVSGVQVRLYERASWPDCWARSALGLLTGELAEWSAPVTVHFHDGTTLDAAEFALAVKLDNQTHAWPSWWGDARALGYGDRREQALQRQIADALAD